MAIGNYSETFELIKGVRLSAVASGIKRSGSDLVLMEFAEGSVAAGVFTENWFAAPPVQICRDHLKAGSPRFFLVNSGNANAATGPSGRRNALSCCEALAELTDCEPEKVLPYSTGVIGEPLPIEKIQSALPELLGKLSEQGWLEAATGIMTTDTRAKIASRKVEIDGIETRLTGIAKGSGMIEPHMATLLVYIATDAGINSDLLSQMLTNSANRSFNRITVDSDTSTNDSCMLVATGQTGLTIERDNTQACDVFQEALTELCIELAQGVIKDAEGVSRFVEVKVVNGKDQQQCLDVGYAIANSPLVKTAVFAGDANWGRIVMAVGKSSSFVDVSRLDLYLGNLCLMHQGEKAKEYNENAGTLEMAKEELCILVDLNAGVAEEKIWTTDLSYDYIKINAEYRT